MFVRYANVGKLFERIIHTRLLPIAEKESEQMIRKTAIDSGKFSLDVKDAFNPAKRKKMNQGPGQTSTCPRVNILLRFK